MSKFDRARVRIVMTLAKLFGVPVQVHQAFFMKGIKD